VPNQQQSGIKDHFKNKKKLQGWILKKNYKDQNPNEAYLHELLKYFSQEKLSYIDNY